MKPKFKRLKKCIRNTAVLGFLFCVLFFPLSVAKSAKKQIKTSVSQLKDSIVAEVADEGLSLSYLKSYLALRPQPDTVNVKEVVQSRLEELIVSEILYQEAVRQDIHLEPNIRWRIQQMLAQRLLEEKVNRPVRERKITEQELQAYYNEKKDEFQRPAQVRLADILIAVDPGAGSDERLQKKKKAEKVLAEVLSHQDERLGFGKRILKYSDTPEKYPRGNTGFFDMKGEPVGLNLNLAREAFKLEKVGQVCEQIVEADDGYHIIMLASRREAVKTSFETVKEQLLRQIYRERIELAQTDYIERLKRNCRIKINQDVFDELVEEQQAKAKALDVKTKSDFPAFPKDINVPFRRPRGTR